MPFVVNQSTLWLTGGCDSSYFNLSSPTEFCTLSLDTKFYHFDGFSTEVVDGPNLPFGMSDVQIAWLNDTRVIIWGYNKNEFFLTSDWPPKTGSFQTYPLPEGLRMRRLKRISMTSVVLNGKEQILMNYFADDLHVLDPKTMTWAKLVGPQYKKTPPCALDDILYAKNGVLLNKGRLGSMCLYDGLRWHDFDARSPNQITHAGIVISKDLFCG
ncbi:hypothetical protein TCAL_15365, partial [Tigriopus californicus]